MRQFTNHSSGGFRLCKCHQGRVRQKRAIDLAGFDLQYSSIQFFCPSAIIKNDRILADSTLSTVTIVKRIKDRILKIRCNNKRTTFRIKPGKQLSILDTVCYVRLYSFVHVASLRKILG